MNKRTVIIGALILLLVILGIVGLFLKKNNSPQSQQTIYTDPGSGASIVENSPERQGQMDNPDPERPSFLGFTTLTDRGLAASQLQNVENAIYSYSSQKLLGFKEVSLTVASIDATPLDSTDPGYYMNFMITVNRKTTYYVHVTYTDFTSCTTAIYKADKTTLLFTQ